MKMNGNNNSLLNIESKGEKYSLRPRISDRIKSKIQSVEDGAGYNNVSSNKNNTCKNKYGNSKAINKKLDNIKQKPVSLSKYRRKTANARERSRMREINLAFETLRKAVPSYMPQLIFPGDGSNEKLTKITTLRLAMKYINGLTELLQNKVNDRPSSYVTNECNQLIECHPIIFRNSDTCTLASLNNSTYDLLNSPDYINEGGSDGESLHSGTNLDNSYTIESSNIETFLPNTNANFDFTENFFNPELS